MQYNYNERNNGVPPINPGPLIYSSPQPPDLRLYDYRYGPLMYENSSNCHQPADFQQPPPCPAYSGMRSSSVPPPIHYHNLNVLPCGTYPNPQFDRDYRQFSSQNVEQGCVEPQNLFNSDQGTCYSQSHNDFQQRGGLYADGLRRSSWEPLNPYTNSFHDQDWRSCRSDFEHQAPTSWESNLSNHGYAHCQDDWHRNHQLQSRERSRSPPTTRDLGYNQQQFSRRLGDNRHSSISNYVDSTCQTSSVPHKPLFAVAQNTSCCRIASEVLLMNPGRKTRPSKILIILRGLPGSGKSTLAKLIKEKEAKAAEAEGKSAAVRVLSMDDFFVNEEGRFVYEPEVNEVYRKQLLKLLARQMDNGLFSFLIVDAINQSVAELEDLAVQARIRHFQVYVIEVNSSLTMCLNRSAGRRLESDIRAIHCHWEPTPSRYTLIDANSLQQEIAAEEVDMEADSGAEEEARLQSPSVHLPSTSNASAKHSNDGDDDDDEEEEEEDIFRGAWKLTKSKWDDYASFQCLERLDGLKQKPHHSTPPKEALSMTEYLEDEPSQFRRRRKEGVKRVTWADIEALRENSRIRELGFVVGQTDWSRMTEGNDEKIASQALTRTKYI